MGSSAQNSSGVHWCRRRVRFNEFRRRFRRFRRRCEKQVRFNRVPEKVPEKVPAKVRRLWCRARSGSTGFRRKFRKRFQEAIVQIQVRFNRFHRGLWRRPGRLWCRAVSEKVPEKVWEGLVQVQQGSGKEGSGQGSGRLCAARSGATGLWRRFPRRFQVQSQVGFNRVLEKVPEKVPEQVGEALVQSQLRFNTVPEKVLARGLSQVRFNTVPEKVPAKV